MPIKFDIMHSLEREGSIISFKSQDGYISVARDIATATQVIIVSY